MSIYKGSGVAIVTPMKANEEVNYDKLEELIEEQISEGTDCIVIAGTTGESSTLSMEEHHKVICAAVEFAKHRVPVVAGTGSNSTETAIQLTQEAEEAGADGALIVTPYYNKATQKGLIGHYSKIAQETRLPIIMYNVPSRTGMSLTYEEIKELKEIPNICGIKEASGNISFVAKVATLIDDNFSMLSGNDDQIVPIMSLGGDGVISVLANIAPSVVHQITSLMLEGNYKDAYKLQLKYLTLANDLFLETNPIPVKEALNYMGFKVGHVRLPLDEMGPKKEVLHQEIDRLGDEIK